MVSKGARGAALALAVLYAAPARAHHPGGVGSAGTAGSINTISADVLDPGQSAVAFLAEYIRLGGLNDAALVAAASRHEHVHSIGSISSLSLAAAYGITNDLMVSVRLPYVTRTDIREGHHEHVGGLALNSVDVRGDARGVGDMTVLGHWRFFNNAASGTQAALLFGIKVPTGRTDLRDRAGELFEAEFQPGSGSVDGLFGAAFTQRFGDWSFSGNVLYTLATRGTLETNLGDRFAYNAGIAYRLLGGTLPQASATRPLAHGPEPHTHHPLANVGAHHHEEGPAWALSAIFELNGEWHARQNTAGVTDPNSGGNVIYASPGLRLSYDRFSAFASVGIPIVNDMNGLQSKPSYRVVGGVAAAF